MEYTGSVEGNKEALEIIQSQPNRFIDSIKSTLDKALYNEPSVKTRIDTINNIRDTKKLYNNINNQLDNINTEPQVVQNNTQDTSDMPNVPGITDRGDSTENPKSLDL